MASYMLLAPGDYMIESALAWGQIRGLGGDRDLAEAIVGSRDRRKTRPLLEFLWSQKFARTKGYNPPRELSPAGF